MYDMVTLASEEDVQQSPQILESRFSTPSLAELQEWVVRICILDGEWADEALRLVLLCYFQLHSLNARSGEDNIDM